MEGRTCSTSLDSQSKRALIIRTDTHSGPIQHNQNGHTFRANSTQSERTHIQGQFKTIRTDTHSGPIQRNQNGHTFRANSTHVNNVISHSINILCLQSSTSPHAPKSSLLRTSRILTHDDCLFIHVVCCTMPK